MVEAQEQGKAPNTIGEYKILRTIGRGGCAAVKLVENDKNEQFAMKIFEQQRDSERAKIIE